MIVSQNNELCQNNNLYIAIIMSYYVKITAYSIKNNDILSQIYGLNPTYKILSQSKDSKLK